MRVSFSPAREFSSARVSADFSLSSTCLYLQPSVQQRASECKVRARYAKCLGYFHSVWRLFSRAPFSLSLRALFTTALGTRKSSFLGTGIAARLFSQRTLQAALELSMAFQGESGKWRKMSTMDRINCRTKSKSATTLQKTLSKATSSGTGLDSNAKLSRPISSKELRVWLAWLIKVVETAEFEWQEWLFSYINFVLKLNESLMKAKQAIEEEERNPNQQLEDCDVARETDSAEAYDVFSIDISCGSDETNYEDMTIRMPTDKNEMDQLIQKFNEEAEKYKSLYEHWLQTANRVNAEIAEKSMMPAEQVNTHEEIPYFVYLKEKTDIDIGIEIDKKEVLESCNGREKITCDNLNLFFNIKN